MSNNWVVVADRTRCRIFAQAVRHGALEELAGLESPRAKLRNQDINADRPGRSFDSAGVARHAMSPSVSPVDQETIRFAKRIAKHLEGARKQQSFKELYLIAEPRFLGHLRSALSRPLHQVVRAELNKDLTNDDPKTIRDRLRQATFED